MTNRETLRSLADAVEALSGPCRETDAAIQSITDGYRHIHPTKLYTHSLDHALKLVPAGCHWSLDSDGPTYLASAAIGKFPTAGKLFSSNCEGSAATPALALTAASLRAIGEGL